MKENLAVIFGGVCCEHDISIISAMQAINHLDKNYYNIIPIYITKQGTMLTGKKLENIASFSHFETKGTTEITFCMGSNVMLKKSAFGFRKFAKIDVALVVMHGSNGEDGKVMSVLEMCSIPYSAPNPIASGVCMDKCYFKEIVKGLNINTINSITVLKHQFLHNPEKTKNEIISALNLPIIIKPATLGSSIGIKVVKSENELENALLFCFNLCSKVLIEEYKESITEINVAVLGEENKLEVSELEQPIKQNEFLSFDNKYQNGAGMETVSRIMPAQVSDEIKAEIISIAKRVFNELELKGVVRFDFIVENNVVYLNEVNTIPGSLAFYLFTPKNINYATLLQRLINYAYSAKNKNDELISYFESSVLNGTTGIKGIKK